MLTSERIEIFSLLYGNWSFSFSNVGATGLSLFTAEDKQGPHRLAVACRREQVEEAWTEIEAGVTYYDKNPEG